MFEGTKIKDEYLTIEQHQKKYEQDFNKHNIVHYNDIYFDLDRNIKANFDFCHSDIDTYLGNNLILLSKPTLTGRINNIVIGKDCTNIVIGNNCQHITIGDNCKDVIIADNNAHITIGDNCTTVNIADNAVQADGILNVKSNVVGLTVSANIVDELVIITEDQKNITLK